MRVIAGEYKGRVLATVNDRSVRPVTDRVKGTIFNMLQNRLSLRGASVLDLFAGSGSLGFEAISRGAQRTLFVEASRLPAVVIESNATALECGERCEVFQTDALKFVEFCDEHFDLIFADPPYAYGRTNEIPGLIAQKALLKPDGFLIIEHSRHTTFTAAPPLELSVQKEFGSTRVSFFHHRGKET